MVFLWILVTWQLRYSMEILDSGWGEWAPWIWICSSFSSSFFPIVAMRIPVFARFCPLLTPKIPRKSFLPLWIASTRLITPSKPGAPGRDHEMGRTIRWPSPPKKVISVPWKHHWLVVYLPLWKIMELKSVGMIIPNILKNEKCSKPPTRLTLNLKDEPQGALSRRISRRMCWNFEPQLAQTRVWYTHLFHNMANPTINLY